MGEGGELPTLRLESKDAVIGQWKMGLVGEQSEALCSRLLGEVIGHVLFKSEHRGCLHQPSKISVELDAGKIPVADVGLLRLRCNTLE